MISTKRQIVFVMCPAHAGSTLLGYLLASGNDAVNLGEFTYVDKRERFNKKGYRVEVQRRGICPLCGNDCKYWSRFDEIVRPPKYHDAAFKVFGAKVLVDTSKKIAWCELAEENSTADISYVRVVRDVRHRWRKTCEKEGGLTRKRVEQWITKEQALTKWLKGRNTVVVRYEDICCQATGYENYDHHSIGGDANARSLVQRAHGLKPENDSFIGRSPQKHQLSDKEIKVLKSAGAFKMNRELGYV